MTVKVKLWRSLFLAIIGAFVIGLSLPVMAVSIPDPGSLLIGKALDEIDAKIQQAMANAQSGVNVEEGATYSLLQNISAELRQELQGSLDQTISAVNDSRAQALRGLYEQVNQIGEQVNGTIFTGESAIVNLKAMLPFSSMPFIIFGQTPSYVSNSGANLVLKLQGNGIGLNQGDRTYNVTASIGSQNLQVQNFPNEVDVQIPASILQKYQNNDSLAYLPMNVTSAITQKCYLGLKDCTTQHQATVTLAIFPRTLATATVQAFQNRDDPGAQRVENETYQTPQMDGVKSCVVHTWPVVSAAPDEMITSAQPAGCNPYPVCNLSLYSQCKLIGTSGAQCTSCDEGPAHQMFYTVHFAKRVPTGHLLSTSTGLQFSATENTDIEFPTSASTAAITGKTWKNEAFSFQLFPINQLPASAPISCSLPIQVGANTRITCQAYVQ
ncbi:hypothetical protein P3T42_005751 [Paraburkholderia sp. GAS38]|uniref:hypothetical protein n=1 Tax=Paraburkholderia sp. GAS38 TaxID=3035133 RepID=UPI003D210CE1